MTSKVPSTHYRHAQVAVELEISCKFELLHDKTNKLTCAPSEDSDQTGQIPRLI